MHHTFQINEDTFMKVVWPILKSHILVDWSNQSFETLYCLIEIQNLFPNVLKKKLILPILNTKSVVHTDSMEIIQKMLTVLPLFVFPEKLFPFQQFSYNKCLILTEYYLGTFSRTSSV